MKKRTKSNKKKARRKKPYKEGTPDELITEADAAMEALDSSKALNLYGTACSMLRGKLNLKVGGNESQTESVLKLAKTLGKLGETKVSMGNPDGAREDFASAIKLLNFSPLENSSCCDAEALHETRAAVHLFYGQLSSDEEALEAYQKGVHELESCIALREAKCSEHMNSGNDMVTDKNIVPEELTLFESRKQLCAAYCALSDLYLTDLCYAENAEVECESNLQSALKITDPADGQPMVDALQTLASLRLSQNRGSEAVRHMLMAYDRMKTGCEALAALVGLGAAPDDTRANQAVELLEVEAANNLPDFEFRVQSSKLLLECASIQKSLRGDERAGDEQLAEHQRCVQASIQVLGSLIAQNDEVVEIWYLLGCAFVELNPPVVDVACQYWQRAKEMLLKVKECLDEDMTEMGEGSEREDACLHLEHVVGQLEEVNEKLQQQCHYHDDMDESQLLVSVKEGFIAYGNS